MHAATAVAMIADADTPALVARAAGGDAKAFEELVRRHHSLVIRWASIAVGDLDEAEDLAQAVWLKAYRNLGDFRGASKFTTWLYRITYNLGFEIRTTRDRRQAALAEWNAATAGDASSEPLHDDGDAEMLASAVHGCLIGLPPRQRAVLTLIDFEGRSGAEVAAMLGIEEGTVRTNLFKARRAIRQRLLQQERQLIEELRA